ncbi:MAG: cupin domain-containing protein [Anaerolineae bacterium]|jgi:quercetin dioxygenase-like cupin family protein
MIVRSADKQPMDVQPGTVRTVLSHGERLMIAEFDLTRGAQIAPHRHPHEQISYVLSGAIRYTIGDDTFELAAGESCLVPPDALHTVEVLVDSKVLDVFAPPREDFLG